MDRLQTLEVFIAVAEAGSFAAGARSIGLSAPSVTRGVNALESRLGARLFTRTTRSIRLTDAGQVYLADARAVLAQLQAADDTAAGAATSPTGLLRITCPNEFGRIYVAPILTHYLDSYPDVSANVLMVDRVVNLVEEGLDVGVRIGALPSSGLTAVRVGEVRQVLCGSPDYFARNGRPQSISDLDNHRIVSAAPSGPITEWRFGADYSEVIKVRPRLVISSIAAAIEVARTGWGLCRVLSYQIGPDLQAGHLQTVLEAHEPKPLPIHLVHIEGRRAAAKVRSFIDFARDELRANTALNPNESSESQN